jgi:hypothetical protein
MILTRDYDGVLKNVAKEYLISSLDYVDDLKSWAKKNNSQLSEPYQPMKLVKGNRHDLTMVIQSELSGEILGDLIKALGVRWALKDTVSNLEKMLNSIKKRLVYYFLKEYARTVEGVSGDELREDEWAIGEMQKLGFFQE